MAIEDEPTHQCFITCCGHVTDGSRGALWQNGVWHGRAEEAKVWNWIPPCRRNGTHWQLLMFAEHLWRPNSGCEHSEAVGSAFQQWCHHSKYETVGHLHWFRYLWARQTGSCSLLVKKHALNQNTPSVWFGTTSLFHQICREELCAYITLSFKDYTSIMELKVIVLWNCLVRWLSF